MQIVKRFVVLLRRPFGTYYYFSKSIKYYLREKLVIYNIYISP